MRSFDNVYESNKAERMTPEQLLAIYDSLSKGDTIRVKYEDSWHGMVDKEFVVKKGKTKVGKFRMERITLVNPKNPKGLKYYFYQRNGRVSFAMGDMAGSLISIER